MEYNKISKTQEKSTHDIPKPVVADEDVVVKKKGAGRQIIDELVSDSVSSIRSYILQDVIIPNLKDVIFDGLMGSVSMMLYGSTEGVSRSGKRTPYDKYYSTGGKRTVVSSSSSVVDNRAYSNPNQYHIRDDIWFRTRSAAQEVLSALEEVVDSYDEGANVADYYGLCNKTASTIDFKWGWHDLSGAVITNTRNGYVIKLPVPKPL